MGRERQRSCTSKVRFATVQEAQLVLVDSAHKFKDDRLEYYKCPFCDGYHIGHIKYQETHSAQLTPSVSQTYHLVRQIYSKARRDHKPRRMKIR